MLEPAGLSAVALDQLAKWEAIAKDWPLYVDEACERCASCHVSVLAVTDVLAPGGGVGGTYVYTDEERLALIVAHLRRMHMEVDPDHE